MVHLNASTVADVGGPYWKSCDVLCYYNYCEYQTATILWCYHNVLLLGTNVSGVMFTPSALVPLHVNYICYYQKENA